MTPNEFLEYIKNKTGVSDDFIEQTREKVNLLFKDVTGIKLQETLKDLELIYIMQAESELGWIKTKENLAKLNKSESELIENLNILKKETQKLKQSQSDLQLIKQAMRYNNNIKA